MTAEEKITQFMQDWQSCVWPDSGLGPFKLRQYARLMVRKGWSPRLGEGTHVCICGRYPHTEECAHR